MKSCVFIQKSIYLWVRLKSFCLETCWWWLCFLLLVQLLLNISFYMQLKAFYNLFFFIWQVILRGRDFFLGTPFFIISFMLKNEKKSLPLKITFHMDHLHLILLLLILLIFFFRILILRIYHVLMLRKFGIYQLLYHCFD